MASPDRIFFQQEHLRISKIYKKFVATQTRL